MAEPTEVSIPAGGQIPAQATSPSGGVRLTDAFARLSALAYTSKWK